MASYKLKHVPFHGTEVPVVLQNENGPCPLIAAANVLILRGLLKLPPKAPDVSQNRLMSLVAEHLLDTNLSVDDSSRYAADLRQNLQDVISVLPKMATGVDVNPKFDSTRGFEFTNEVAIFDLMNISVVHGWLFDPQDSRHARALKNQSYNQVVSRLAAIMGEQMPKHLLTPQNSMPSRTGSLKATVQSSASPAGSKAGQGSKPVLGEQNTTGSQPRSNSVGDLISFDDDAVILAAPPSLVVQSQGGGGAESGSDHGEGGETVEDLINELVASVAEGKRHENGTEPEGLGKEEGSSVGISTSKISDRPAGESSSRNPSHLVAREDVPDPETGGRQPPPAKQQKSKQQLEREAEDAKFAAVAQEFLESTSSQLTVHGLCQLHDALNDNELAVFFRNNHFNTMYKYNGALYILVTDQGYMSEEGVVWEKLNDVDGDTQYVTCDFLPYTKTVSAIQVTDEEMDLQRALAESVETCLPSSLATRAQQDPPAATPRVDEDADYALALQLHEEMVAESERSHTSFQPQERQRHLPADATGQQTAGMRFAYPPMHPRQQSPGQAAGPAQNLGRPAEGSSMQEVSQQRPRVAARPQTTGSVRQRLQQQQPVQQPAGATTINRMWHSMKNFLKRS